MSYIFEMFFKFGIMSFYSYSSSDDYLFFGESIFAESLGRIKGTGLDFGFGINDDFFNFFFLFFFFIFIIFLIIKFNF